MIGGTFAMIVAMGAGCAERAPAPQTPPRLSVLPSWVEGAVCEGQASLEAPPQQPSSTTLYATESLGEAPYSGEPKKTVTYPRPAFGGSAEYVGRRIDLDVKGADVHEVCRLLAEVGKINIVVADDVKGSVTIKMKNVPWDQALDAILRAKGFASERDGNVVTVYAP
jgi:hypothetical protein